MRSAARVVLALQLAAAAVLLVAQTGALAQTPSPSSSPSAATPSAGSPSPSRGSPGPSDSPSPSTSSTPPQPSPSATTTPAPTTSPSDRGQGALEVTSGTTALVTQVGDDVDYDVTVANPGTAPLHDVFVVDLLPREVTFASAVISPQAEATLYGKVGTQENITWNIGRLRPGQRVVLRWTGTVSTGADLTALNAVRAVASGVRPVRGTDSTYLASTSLRPGANPSPTPTESVVVPAAGASGGVLGAASGSASSGSGSLPTTGFDPRLDLGLALTLAVLGALVWWAGAQGSPRRRRVVAAVITLGLLTACTAGRDVTGAGPRPRVSPQVKGKRIGSDDGGTGRGRDHSRPAGDRKGAQDRPGAPAQSATPVPSTAPAATAPAAAAPPAPQVVLVAPQLLPAADLGDRAGDNVLSYEWDGDRIDAQASSTTASGPSQVGLEATVATASGTSTAVVTLTNETSERPIRATGRILLALTGGGKSAVLRSDPFAIMLQPGGSTSATFTYDLPPGTYSAKGSFSAH